MRRKRSFFPDFCCNTLLVTALARANTRLLPSEFSYETPPSRAHATAPPVCRLCRLCRLCRQKRMPRHAPKREPGKTEATRFPWFSRGQPVVRHYQPCPICFLARNQTDTSHLPTDTQPLSNRIQPLFYTHHALETQDHTPETARTPIFYRLLSIN